MQLCVEANKVQGGALNSHSALKFNHTNQSLPEYSCDYPYIGLNFCIFLGSAFAVEHNPTVVFIDMKGAQ